MTKEKIEKISDVIAEVAAALLKDDKIHAVCHRCFSTEEEAKNWLIKISVHALSAIDKNKKP